MSGQQTNRVARTCLELGVCQGRKPACADCETQTLKLAPGVIDGPYNRPSKAREWAQIVRKGTRLVVGYLRGPSP